jgi:hypothetical protein
MRRSGARVVLAIALLVGGCAAGPGNGAWVWPTAAPLPVGAIEVPLDVRTPIDISPSSEVACDASLLAPVEVRYVAADATQPIHYRFADSGRALHVVWPVGFRAWLDPTLQIVGSDGKVIARDGDVLSNIGGGGGNGGSDTVGVCFVEYLPTRAVATGSLARSVVG